MVTSRMSAVFAGYFFSCQHIQNRISIPKLRFLSGSNLYYFINLYDQSQHFNSTTYQTKVHKYCIFICKLPSGFRQYKRLPVGHKWLANKLEHIPKFFAGIKRTYQKENSKKHLCLLSLIHIMLKTKTCKNEWIYMQYIYMYLEEYNRQEIEPVSR